MEIVVHVGMHKTGSSYLQKMLYGNYDLLVSKGVLFPRAGFEDIFAKGGREGSTAGHNDFIKYSLLSKNKRKECLYAFDSEVKRTNPELVFISAENFSHHLTDCLAQEIKDLFGQYGRVKIVVTLREPVSWVESYYREIVTNGWGFESKDFPIFLRKFRSALCYKSNIEKYVDVFGDANVDTIIYGKSLKDAGIENVFKSYIGLDGVELESIEQTTNASSSNEFFQAVRVFNRKVLPTQEARNSINSISNELRVGGSKGSIVSQVDLDFIVSEFRSSLDFLKLRSHYFGDVSELIIDGKAGKAVDVEESKVDEIFALLMHSNRGQSLKFSSIVVGTARKVISYFPAFAQVFFKKLWMKK
ncbi:MAG: hypothetical protein RPR97_16060 [Colwellia sp.]